MEQLAALSDALDSRDPGVGLAAVAALRTLVEELEALHVANARDQGWSWQAIAERLGITRQSVHKKHRSDRRLRRG
jgi:Homeodomain-like domain